jgi:quinol monooxygenase YgiN
MFDTTGNLLAHLSTRTDVPKRQYIVEDWQAQLDVQCNTHLIRTLVNIALTYERNWTAGKCRPVNVP